MPLANFIDTARRSMRSGVYETIERPSVCLSVCSIIRPPHAAEEGLLLWARRQARRQEMKWGCFFVKNGKRGLFFA